MTQDTEDVVAAAAIVDIWMGGDTSWRSRLGDSDFLESADWMNALELAQAVLKASERQSLSDRIDGLEAERKQHLERLRQYQSHLQIVPMLLGPKAWELWRGWVDKEWLPTMLYQHYSWGPKARPGDGEAIAEMLLNVRDELASGKCKPLDFDD